MNKEYVYSLLEDYMQQTVHFMGKTDLFYAYMEDPTEGRALDAPLIKKHNRMFCNICLAPFFSRIDLIQCLRVHKDYNEYEKLSLPAKCYVLRTMMENSDQLVQILAPSNLWIVNATQHKQKYIKNIANYYEKAKQEWDNIWLLL